MSSLPQGRNLLSLMLQTDRTRLPPASPNSRWTVQTLLVQTCFTCCGWRFKPPASQRGRYVPCFRFVPFYSSIWYP